MGWDRLMNVFRSKDQQIDIALTEDGKISAATTLVPPPPPPPPPPAPSQSPADALSSILSSNPAKTDPSLPMQDPGQSGFEEPGKPVPKPEQSIVSKITNAVDDATSNLPSIDGTSLPFSPEKRPSGMPGAKEEPGFFKKAKNAFSKAMSPDKEVYNISRNIYTYDEAAPLCKAMGAELATYEQLSIAQQNGADWCNYGWVKGQMAIFPTSESTWNKLQMGPQESRHSCGKPGVNGGFFDNPELRFGVNCFGPKPEKKDSDELSMESANSGPPTAEQIEFDKKVQKFRDQMGNVAILPWSREKWEGSD